MRDDIAALVAAWDRRTAKKARGSTDQLDALGDSIGPETAIAVEPSTTYFPEAERYGGPGLLCLTESRLLFQSGSGLERLAIADIDELNLYRGGSSFLSSLATGGMIQVRVGSESRFYELQSEPATERIWTALREQWSAAKDAATRRSG